MHYTIVLISSLERTTRASWDRNSPGLTWRAWLVRFDHAYLREQSLFESYPEDLVQITDSGKGRELS